MSDPFAVILVESTSQALRIEKLLVKHNLTCKLIPVPRHLSSDCGVCVRILKRTWKRSNSLFKNKALNSKQSRNYDPQ